MGKMIDNILLLGEFSGLHRNLKEGLEVLGKNVLTVSDGDGKKQIFSDRNLDVGKGIGTEAKMSNLAAALSEYKGFDVVQFINPYISFPLGVFAYETIFKNNKDIFCLAAGDDYEYIHFIKNQSFHNYSPFDEDLRNLVKLPYNDRKDSVLHRIFMNKVKKVIPIMYDYAEAYRNSPYSYNNLASTIPLPMNIDKVVYSENKISNGKLVLYHGILRSSFKGTPYVIAALEKLKENYPSDVEIYINDRLPLDKYMEVIQKTNVVIDQCRSQSYGMNALYSMAMGKVVMSGAECEALTELGIKKTPIINIIPDSDFIYSQLVALLDRRDEITRLGQRSREYVEHYHHYVNIAQTYLDTWQT